jgi:hypothetical protein
MQKLVSASVFFIMLSGSLVVFREGLKYSDISGLEQSIDSAYQSASQRLFDVFLNKFKLVDHLRALKQYLMLGHGDFADQLMDSLGLVVLALLQLNWHILTGSR